MRFNGLSLTTRSCGFVDIFNPALVVIARGWQELRDLINAVCTAATEGSGRKADRLTDFEFVLVHLALHRVQRDCAPPFAEEPDNFNCQLQGKYYYHEIASGAISKGSISWFMSLRVLAKLCARSGPNH